MSLRPHLVLVLEASRPSAGGARFSLEGVEEVVLGRGPHRSTVRRHDGKKKALHVHVPARAMSSTHARITLMDDAWVVVDERSTNGTWLNGKRVDRAKLADGDLLELGHTFFILRTAWATPLSGPMDAGETTISQEAPALRTLVPHRQQELDDLVKIAGSKVPVLLLGETGTGKELVARAVHDASRRTGAFVAVNCGALPESLVEGLLFGHAKGAFSGATQDAPGFVRAADGGTLFLDEIGDLPMGSQAALLRVLQESEVTPVGSTRSVRVDLRVIAATHRPIDALTSTGGFRADLLARLRGFTHSLTPLRRRKEDLGVIVADILGRIAGERTSDIRFSGRAARALFAHDWPLNIRELDQCLAAGIVLESDGVIEPEHLTPGLAALAAAQERATSPIEDDIGSDADEVASNREALIAQLEIHRGNVSAVARAMGKAPMQIRRWLKRWLIDADRYRD